jgi:hypothetical protein
MSDKLPLKSKKFIAYLIADVGWKVCILYMLYSHAEKFAGSSASVMLTMVLVSGFVQVGYILGQAALDKYVNMTADKDNKGAT